MTSAPRPENLKPMSNDGPLLHLERVELGYRQVGFYRVAVNDATFSLFSGERVMLLGPSGCGKSTILKAVAGYVQPSAGTISVAGNTNIRPGPDRAVVFQEFDQLFPWRTALANVVYPLRKNGVSKLEAVKTAENYLEIMGLTERQSLFPHQLSGGMKQRVAIARAFALAPSILLMDEPFGSLDAQTRSRLQNELLALANRIDVTILFVTHSIQEALFLGTRVVVLSDGPSHVADVLDTRGYGDPESPEFAALTHHIRSLLMTNEQEDTQSAFE